jgi:putative aldouronate transport system permease protein
MKTKLIGYKKGDIVFDINLYIIMLLIGIVTIYPFLNVLALSFNDAIDAVRGDIYIWPRKFTLLNYAEIFKNNQLITGFKITTLRTVLGTILGVICSSMLAYTLSRRDFSARKVFSLMFAVTMYVHGGLIPGYLLMRNLHLFNTFWVYILPSLVGAWNVFVIRSYIDGLPESLQESAKIDGANDIVIFFKIVMPLCMPVLATVGLFIAVSQWNSWFDTYLYCNSNKELTTLQYELQKMLSYTTIQFNGTGSTQDLEQLAKKMVVTPESLKMAMTIVVTVPILLVYPFAQKYFVKGLTLGAVKS